jgi:CHAD domain-containing protein
MSNPARQEATAQAVMARTPPIDDLTTPDEAGRAILFECLAHISANVGPVVGGHNPEALHQLRVGLRRLRVGLETFGDAAPAFAELQFRAKAFTVALGPARELDVFLDELFAEAVAKLEPQRGFDILRVRAEKARAQAWNEAARKISGKEFARFQEDVAAAARKHIWPVEDKIILPVLIPALMQIHVKRVAKRASAVAEMSPNECHRLRIALKKLRYSAEFFATLYKRKRVRKFIDPLKELQDLLGRLNDAAQVRAVLERLKTDEAGSARSTADVRRAAGLLNEWHQARAERVAKKMLKRWRKFENTEPFWS